MPMVGVTSIPVFRSGFVTAQKGKCQRRMTDRQTNFPHIVVRLLFAWNELTLACRERSDVVSESRGGGVNSSSYRRGRGGGGRGGYMPATDDGFDRFGKREFERHSGSDKTYVRLRSSDFLFTFTVSHASL